MKEKIQEEIHIFSLQMLGFKRTKELVGGYVLTCNNPNFKILKIDELYYADYYGQTIYHPLTDLAHLTLLYRMLFKKQLRRKPSLMLKVLK